MCCTVRNFQYTLSNVNRVVLSQSPCFFQCLHCDFGRYLLSRMSRCIYSSHVLIINSLTAFFPLTPDSYFDLAVNSYFRLNALHVQLTCVLIFMCMCELTIYMHPLSYRYILISLLS